MNCESWSKSAEELFEAYKEERDRAADDAWALAGALLQTLTYGIVNIALYDDESHEYTIGTYHVAHDLIGDLLRFIDDDIDEERERVEFFLKQER